MLSNPKKIPANGIITTNNKAIIIYPNVITVKYFENKIFQRLTGFISRNFIVPCENSFAIQLPAIIIISKPISEIREVDSDIADQKLVAPSVELDMVLFTSMSMLCSNLYRFIFTCSSNFFDSEDCVSLERLFNTSLLSEISVIVSSFQVSPKGMLFSRRYSYSHFAPELAGALFLLMLFSKSLYIHFLQVGKT